MWCRSMKVVISSKASNLSLALSACTSRRCPAGAGEAQNAPLAGNIFKVLVQPGQAVEEGQLVIILEAMKMETEIPRVQGWHHWCGQRQGW